VITVFTMELRHPRHFQAVAMAFNDSIAARHPRVAHFPSPQPPPVAMRPRLPPPLHPNPNPNRNPVPLRSRSWSQRTIRESWGLRIHLCGPGVVRSPDGREIALLLRGNSRTRNSHVVFSRDEGKSWSPPRELPAALTGDRHTARYTPEGRLFIAFRNSFKASSTAGDWVARIGRYEDITEGRDGQYRVRLMDNHHAWDCAYPGVEILPDGTLVTTTYGHWEKDQPPYIVSIRLRLDELDRQSAAPQP